VHKSGAEEIIVCNVANSCSMDVKELYNTGKCVKMFCDSIERFMCRITSLFLLQRLKENMSGDAPDFNNVEKRAVIIFFSARQGAEGNSRH